jgi:hypothetical protein
LFKNNLPKIVAANALLDRAIIQATYLSFPILEREIQDLVMATEAFDEEYSHNQSFALEEQRTLRKQQNQDLKVKKTELENKKKQLNYLQKIEKIYIGLKSLNTQLAAEIKNYGDLKTKKWLINQICCEILLNFIKQNRSKLGLPIGLTKQLIDQIIDESSIKDLT